MRVKTGLLTIFAAALLAGCGKSPEGGSAERKEAQSPSDQVIEGVTGKTAIDAGRRARSTIDRVNKQRRKDYKDALGE